jgi:hypothetical protein
MRKLRQSLFIITLLLLGSVTMSQAQSTKEMLTKGWSFSFEGIMEYLPEIEKQKMQKMPDDQRNMMKAMMEKSYIIFKGDGTMLAAMNTKEETMTWALSENDTVLTTVEESGKTTKLKIIKLTKDQLVLTEIGDDKGMKLVFKPKKD